MSYHLCIVTILIKKTSLYRKISVRWSSKSIVPKKDGRSSDLTLNIEKLQIEKLSASSIDQIAPDIEHVSNNISDQESSSAGGQHEKENARSAKTGLTEPRTGPSGDFKNSSKTERKERPSNEELLAKYNKEEVSHKQKSRPNKNEMAKSLPKHQEQSDLPQQQGIHVFASYPFAGPLMPWFWSHSDYYSPYNYNMIRMQLYGIQYPISYSNYGSSQLPIAASSNLAKIGACANLKQYENNNKPGYKYTAEVAPLGLISYLKEKTTNNALERGNRATN